jgi:hypothetical protein
MKILCIWKHTHHTQFYELAKLKDHALTDETKNALQMIIDRTLCLVREQKDHNLMDGTENKPQIMISKIRDGRGRARQDHLVGFTLLDSYRIISHRICSYESNMCVGNFL